MNELNKIIRLCMFVICAYLILTYTSSLNNTLTPVTLLTIAFIIIDTYFPKIDKASYA